MRSLPRFHIILFLVVAYSIVHYRTNQPAPPERKKTAKTVTGRELPTRVVPQEEYRPNLGALGSIGNSPSENRGQRPRPTLANPQANSSSRLNGPFYMVADGSGDSDFQKAFDRQKTLCKSNNLNYWVCQDLAVQDGPGAPKPEMSILCQDCYGVELQNLSGNDLGSNTWN